MLFRRFALLICFIAVSASIAYAYKVEKPEQLPTVAPRNDIFEYKHGPREATLISVGEQGKSAKAEIGKAIFLAQTYILYPGYRLKKSLKGLMPGSLMIPFRFWLNPGDLFFRGEDTNYLYFAPQQGNSGASFPGLGEVVSGNDSVGIRRQKKDNHLEWYVNNSSFNNTSRNIIWHRDISTDEKSAIDYVPEGLPFKVLGMKKIVYDGFFNGSLIFTLIDSGREERIEKEYRFTPNLQGDTIAVVGGIVIKCSDISQEGMTYTLLSINEH